MITPFCVSLFFILCSGLELDTIFYSYAPQRIESIRKVTLSYVLKERPYSHDQCLRSHVCSDDRKERWKRCEEAIRIDECRHREIRLSSMFGILEEPAVYEFKLVDSYKDVVRGCACPTKPKLILLADAHGSSVGQVNVMIYEPKPLTKMQKIDAYGDKFTGLVRDVLPGESKPEDKPRKNDGERSPNDAPDGGDYSSDSPDRNPSASEPRTLTAQFGTYKDKLADKVNDAISSESGTKDKTNKSDHQSSSRDSLDRDFSNVFASINKDPDGNSSTDASKGKYAFWSRKKKSPTDVDGDSAKKSTSGLSRMQSFGDSRFGSFNSGDSAGDGGYEYGSDSVSAPDTQRSEEESADFKNPFADLSVGQSSSQDQRTDVSTDKKAKGPAAARLKGRRKLKGKIKKTVKKFLD